MIQTYNDWLLEEFRGVDLFSVHRSVRPAS